MNDKPPRVIQSVLSPGGIEAWLVEDHTIPLLVVDCAFKGGSAHDPEGKHGCSYLMTSLLDEGAGPYDSQAFHTHLSEKAIQMSFSTDRDGWYGSFKTTTAYTDDAFRLFRLALCEPRFDHESIERVRAQIMAILRQEAQNPSTLAGRAFFSGLFPDHPYGLPIRGTLESLAQLSESDLKEMYRRAFARDRLVVTVTGSITPENLAQYLDATFGSLPKSTLLPFLKPAQIASLGTQEHIKIDAPQSVICFGRPGLMRDDPDFIPAVVVNHILGGSGLTSRLFREVREKRGLAYGVSSSLNCYTYAGLFSGGTATQAKQVDDALSVIKSQIKDLVEHGPTHEELEDAKTFLIGSYPLRFDTSSKTSSHLLHIALEGLGIDYISKRNGFVQAVTYEDTLRAAQRLFEKGELFTVVAGQ
jgi:zinc protease